MAAARRRRSSPSLRLRLIDLLSEVALALNAQLDDGHVEVRLAGRDPELVFVDEPAAPRRAAGARRRPECPRSRCGSQRGSRRASRSRRPVRPSPRTPGSSARSPARSSRAPRGDRRTGSRASPGADGKEHPMFSLALFGPFDPDPVERRRPRRRGDGRVDSRPSVPPRFGAAVTPCRSFETPGRVALDMSGAGRRGGCRARGTSRGSTSTSPRMRGDDALGPGGRRDTDRSRRARRPARGLRSASRSARGGSASLGRSPELLVTDPLPGGRRPRADDAERRPRRERPARRRRRAVCLGRRDRSPTPAS